MVQRKGSYWGAPITFSIAGSRDYNWGMCPCRSKVACESLKQGAPTGMGHAHGK